MEVYAPASTGNAVAERGSAAAALFLVGDGGKLKHGDPLLDLLRDEVAAAVHELGAGNVATVLLGDNLYPRGLPVGDDLDSASGAALRLQLGAARPSQTYVVLGNHDWNHTRRGGRARALNQIQAVERWAEANGAAAVVLPGRICPVPTARDVGATFRLLFLDTQWWLHPDDSSADYCPGTPHNPEALERVSRELLSLLSGAGDRLTVVVAHHPLESGGPHGFHFGLRQHLLPLTDLHPGLALPLPVVGSLALALRPSLTTQDLRSVKYRHLRRWADRTLAGQGVFAWAGGHEHGLQVIEGGGAARWHLVSGAATPEKREPIAVLPRTRLAAARNGYLRLDGDGSGNAKVTMTFLENGGTVRRESTNLSGPDGSVNPREAP